MRVVSPPFHSIFTFLPGDPVDMENFTGVVPLTEISNVSSGYTLRLFDCEDNFCWTLKTTGMFEFRQGYPRWHNFHPGISPLGISYHSTGALPAKSGRGFFFMCTTVIKYCLLICGKHRCWKTRHTKIERRNLSHGKLIGFRLGFTFLLRYWYILLTISLITGTQWEIKDFSWEQRMAMAKECHRETKHCVKKQCSTWRQLHH